MKIKNLLFAILLGGLAAFSSQAQFVQCDRDRNSPIQCGYFEEGYQDGVRDARDNRGSDYRRYRNKLDNRYETIYSRGYDAGYGSVSLSTRWDSTQREAYDRGYREGGGDNRRGVTRSPERYEGRYDRIYEAYFKKGYYDGYDGIQKQYDTDVGGNPIPLPTPVGRATNTGNLSWSGRVDNRVNIFIQGANVRNEDLTGSGFQSVYQNMNGVLPRRPATVSVAKREGRGSAFVLEQPSRANNYTAIVQVSDDRSGADNYRLDISWTAGSAAEPYQSGRVVWRGRVDQTVNVSIAGNDVQTQDISTGRVSNVSFNIDGSLARRSGNVSVRKIRGRGTVSILQQPGEDNDYTAVIQVFDPENGDSDYELEVTW